MLVILVTEIWGRTPHVDLMAETLGLISNMVKVVDPYDETDQQFTNEEEAYSSFITRCGHDEYTRRVSHAVSRATEPVHLVGFSAGAGAVWATVCEGIKDTVHDALCFYGSSIRTMLDAVPTVPVELIFPEHEPHFNVQDVVHTLREKPMTQCHTVPYGHGFMNPLSANYDSEGYKLWSQWIQNHLISFP
ncbi:dienelactone hydrolase [Pseudodesulfovibrio nedwellii]|uniref:Dienelactone hydrolase n=1 Tax=Pseudodesulfovibrio nedwellii TaxID=2973072 RepID=A0ABM8B058_9BACT|nr:dienelactone hydrolase family protein [Pseudodesulfovibrio nedwellii]BDQ37173.1 dienelactone hydrolase [Pseudodesulfovibrio nedwellii]